MKLTRMLLSCMIAALIVPAAYADDNDQQHKFGERRTESKVATNATVAQATASSQGRFNQPRLSQPQVNTQRPSAAQPNNQFHFTPINTPKPNTPLASAPVTPERFQGTNQSFGSRSDHDSGQKQSPNNQGSHNPSFNNNVNVNNRGKINNNANTNNRGFNRGPHFTPGWVNHYRMPYRQGSSGGYRVNYVHSWPSNYGWRAHGWREDYRTVDPYWFALITSMAVAQAWSDAEIAQAINDDNLRQQMIYDADVRQQMIDSGYPAAQVDYPSADDGYDSSYSDDQGVPADYADQDPSNQDQYPNSQEPTPVQSSYYPPPNQPAPTSVNPNSPLYNDGQDATAPSGEQIANLNANKNALFFCTAGNKQEAIRAFSQIQSPDLTIWKTTSSFDRCAAWATP